MRLEWISYFKASAQCCCGGGGTSWRRLGEAEDEAKDRRFLTHDDNDEEHDWTDSRSRCHKDVCCAAHELLKLAGGGRRRHHGLHVRPPRARHLLRHRSCAACKASAPAGQKSNRRDGRALLASLAFLCAGMQCIAMLRGPLWARTVYHIEITDDADGQNGYGTTAGGRESTRSCSLDH